MTVRDAMSRLKNSFAYERFRKAASQIPLDIKELSKAIVALSQEESKLLDRVFTSICKNNLSPKMTCNNPDDANRIIDGSKTMAVMLVAVDRWRKELMPDWHERRKGILESRRRAKLAEQAHV